MYPNDPNIDFFYDQMLYLYEDSTDDDTDFISPYIHRQPFDEFPNDDDDE